jgi:hypothetical protein
MAPRPLYSIQYVVEVYEHLDFVDNKYHRLIAAAIIQQLSHTPLSQTRNRKLLAEPASFGATWELRCGPKNAVRVFYSVDQTERVVTILAIGVKERNRLSIGGQEIEL